MSLSTANDIVNAVGAEQPVWPGSIEAQPTGYPPLPPTPSTRAAFRKHIPQG
jgi:hypothetical protein